MHLSKGRSHAWESLWSPDWLSQCLHHVSLSNSINVQIFQGVQCICYFSHYYPYVHLCFGLIKILVNVETVRNGKLHIRTNIRHSWYDLMLILQIFFGIFPWLAWYCVYSSTNFWLCCVYKRSQQKLVYYRSLYGWCTVSTFPTFCFCTVSTFPTNVFKKTYPIKWYLETYCS